MTNPSPNELSCKVEGADKLPAGIGAEGICGAIRAAAGADSRGSVIVRVKSRHVITVAVTDARGVSHPEIGASVADAELSPRTVERLAQEVARQLHRNH